MNVLCDDNSAIRRLPAMSISLTSFCVAKPPALLRLRAPGVSFTSVRQRASTASEKCYIIPRIDLKVPVSFLGAERERGSEEVIEG